MFETFRNAWKIEDLRKRLLFTFLILVLFRLGCAIPVPYITASALSNMFAGGTGDMLEYLNMMSGGALSECTIFALGVQPAINASIIWVRGRPSSLFWLPSVLMVLPRALRAVAQNSLVVVLPTLPVTPTTLGANWAR